MRTHERDAGLRRLKRLTVLSGVGAGALVVGFAGLAARSFPGRHATRTPATSARRTQQRVVSAPVATPPPLVALNSSSAAPAGSSAPSSAPTQAQSAPVAVSGGS